LVIEQCWDKKKRKFGIKKSKKKEKRELARIIDKIFLTNKSILLKIMQAEFQELTNSQWLLIEAFFTKRTRKHDLRTIPNAIFWLISAEIEALLKQWTAMQSNAKDAQKSKWEDIGNKNKAFIPTNEAEKIEKAVNQYVVNYHLQENILSESDLSGLYNLASLCANKNSTAVFRARSLYELSKGIVIDWRLIENCKGNSIPIESKISKQTADFHANVFPNPATNQITIQVDNAKNFTGEAVFYNLQGQEVFRRNISGNDTFDIENLSNSVYYLQVQQDGICLETHKIVLVK
jgi:hypothetical protein